MANLSNNTMEYRINLEKLNKRNDQVTELILDNCRATQITGLTDEFINLEILSLINVGLVTLKGFPKLPNLKKLELSDNRITGGLHLLHQSKRLQHLNLSGNRIKDFDSLEPLKEFHDLVNLDLYNCEVTKCDDYRQKVFNLLPNLHSLDGYDRNEKEVADSDESEEEGSDIENRITREDDEEEEGESSDFNEEELNGVERYDEDDEDADDGIDEEDEDVEDEEDDEEDDDDDDIDHEEGDESDLKQLQRDIDDEEGDGSDLKQLQRDIDEEDSKDGDFEPTHEPDERDYEIDPEDDDDEDEDDEEEDDDDEGEHLEDQLSTSKFDTSATSGESRGQKRKHEDEGGDEGEIGEE